MSSPVNDCVGIDEAVDVVLCWRAFVAGTIAGVCGMDCPFCVSLALHLAAGGGAHQCRVAWLRSAPSTAKSSAVRDETWPRASDSTRG